MYFSQFEAGRSRVKARASQRVSSVPRMVAAWREDERAELFCV